MKGLLVWRTGSWSNIPTQSVTACCVVWLLVWGVIPPVVTVHDCADVLDWDMTALRPPQVLLTCLLGLCLLLAFIRARYVET